MNIRMRYLHEISEYRNFKDYAIDTQGNVWSFKGVYPKKLKTSYKNKKGNQKYGEFVCLSNKLGQKTSVTIQRLMCLAFHKRTDDNKLIRHISGNRKDNSIDNLEWVSKKQKKTDKQYSLNETLSDKAKIIYFACIKKGLKVGTFDEFLDSIFNKSLDDYVMQYGLRKVM